MKPLIFIIATSIFLAACTQESQAPEDHTSLASAIPVRVAPVGVTGQARSIQTSGTVASKEEVKLAFKIGGILSAVYAEEGRAVRKGQVLAKLDPIEINAQVSQARSAVEKARRDLERAQRLYEDTVITLEQVQNLTTARDVAEANLQIATFNQQQASIVAPAHGVILRRFAEEGEVVSPGMPVCILATEGEGQLIRAGLTDVDVVKIQLGDPAEVRFDAYPAAVFAAEVSEIAASADARTGTFEVEFSLTDNGKLIKNGFVGRVSITPASGGDYLQVPLSALVAGTPREAVVFVPDASYSEARKMVLHSYQLGRNALVVSREAYPDLKEVITDGAKYLYEGAEIRVEGKSKEQLVHGTPARELK